MQGGEDPSARGLQLKLIQPDWPLSGNLRAVQSTRMGGVSLGPFQSLNLATHTGDSPAAVQENRARLAEALGLARPLVWPRQVHGAGVAAADSLTSDTEADAVVGFGPGVVCSVQTADCLPVLFASLDGTSFAAAHAGWRGLAAGVLEATIHSMRQPRAAITAWIGPAIGPQAFEVGPEVREVFLRDDPGAGPAFHAGRGDRWNADLYALARRRLARAGLVQVYGGEYCSFSDPSRFFSYRRDGVCGRMASVIWCIA